MIRKNVKQQPAATSVRSATRRSHPMPFVTFIASLGRAHLEVRKPIPVTLEPEDDGSYIASFLDASVASGGETVQDAVESLQDMLATSFERLTVLPDSKLGPRMRREREILLEFVCRSSTKTTPKKPRKS
jgi:predicted RNase H-like HicB family nuclease